MRINRQAQLNRQGLDPEARTVPVTIATDAPIRGVSLSHAQGAVELNGDDGLPLIIAHRLEGALPVGRVLDVTVGEHETTGVAKLSRGSAGQAALADIEDGILTDVSIGAEILDWSEDRTVARSWRPVEVSLVAAGMDPAAKIHREDKPVYELALDDKATAELEQRRRARVESINRLFTGLDTAEWQRMRADAIAGTDAPETIAAQVLDKLKGESKRIEETPSAQETESAADKMIRGFAPVLELRAHNTAARDPDAKAGKHRELEDAARQSEFYSYSLLDMAREWLRVNNVPIAGKGPGQIADAAILTRAGGIISHSGGDFASLVTDTASKSLAIGYEEVATTWARWCATGSLPDFKTAERTNLSSFSDMDRIRNDEEYQYGTMDDKHETAQLRTYGKLFSLGRTLIINDDLDALGRVPQAMGRAVNRQLNSDVYDVLVDNAAMNEDSVALFHANHGNYTASGAAPSVAQLDAAMILFRRQNALGPDGGAQTGAILNLVPRFMIVPPDLEATARALLRSTLNPAEGATTSFQQPNIYEGAFELVVDAELTDTQEWYLAASPTNIDTVTVFFLNGVQTPTLEQEQGFTRDGLTYKVRHDFVARALDFRGLYKNEGA